MKTIIITDNLIDSSIFPSACLYNLQSIDIKPCIKCLNCVVKTPGKCIFHDSDLVNNINQIALQSNLIIVITKIKYGCYNIPIKRFIERSLPNILQISKLYNKKTLASSEFIDNKKVIFIGYDVIYPEEINIFKDLIKNNILNLCIKSYELYICKSYEITGILEKIGGRINA